MPHFSGGGGGGGGGFFFLQSAAVPPNSVGDVVDDLKAAARDTENNKS